MCAYGRYLLCSGGEEMQVSNLNKVEKKVLGAMLILADENMSVQANMTKIANIMGYKASGGAISFAIQALEMKNYIAIKRKCEYQVLI